MELRRRDPRLGFLLFGVYLAAASGAAQTYEVVHAFVVSGGHPAGPVVISATGVLYGTTRDGGVFARGSVFSLTPDGAGGFTLLTLHSFAGPDGAAPNTALIFGADGNLYGTTHAGGAAGTGTVFRIEPSGSLTRLHDFADGGGQLPSELVLASDGAFYGTTSAGGDHGGGTVFRIGADEVLATVHSFDGAVEGAAPTAGLLQAGPYLYGTTSAGGTDGHGTAFRLDFAGALTTLHSFDGTDGDQPSAALILALDGNFYGTTLTGGVGFGTIFRMDMSGSVTSLHSFNNTDGYAPGAPLIQAGDGKLYGTTAAGGEGGGKDHFPAGTVFRIDSLGNFEHLYSFDAGLFGTPGYSPSSALVDGHDGYLYGTTEGAQGSLYRITLAGSVSYPYPFPADGRPYHPAGPLTEAYGALYGTTSAGGTIFRLEGPSLTVLQPPGGTTAKLLLASDGNLYGTSPIGGTGGSGAAFRLNSSGDFETLHSFGGADGDAPVAGLLESPAGEFYGTTSGGGDLPQGSVFHMDTSGTVTTLHAFDGVDGFYPESELIHAADGKFYGTTPFGGVGGLGNIFSMTALGVVTSIHEFIGTDGAFSVAGLVEAIDGDFYGVTSGGGTNTRGTIYRADATGMVTTLHAFTGPDGAMPQGTLIQAPDDEFYGTAEIGGPNVGSPACGPAGCGTLFRIDALGNFDVLHEFTGADGKYPVAGLLQASDGAFYGTATEGGFGGVNGGVVFRLVPGAVTPSPVGIDPSSGRAGGGTPVTISGDHLYSATAVSIGGVAATPLAIPDQATIFAVSPPLVPGTLNDVRVDEIHTLTAAWFADFNDVPQDDIFHSYVETIFRDGITAGCGGGNYCRNDSVTRAQMSVFLLKAEHGSAYLPPDCASAFPDVPCPSPFADWIEQLAAEGVTVGCGGGNYCPGDPVTRRQMAVFLLKTKEGSGYTPPAAVGVFDDVPPADAFAPWVEELYVRQVTGGCQASPPLYCPGNPSTRGQMAVFLVKTFGL